MLGVECPIIYEFDERFHIQTTEFTPNEIVCASETNKFSFNIGSYLFRSFLPIGYPGSVREEYFTFQIWDILQALTSYLRGVLSTHAVLKGSGVGSADISAITLAITWVFLDGFGMFSSVLFSSSFSHYFENYVKEWRFFTYITYNCALVLDIISPLVHSSYYIWLISISAVLYAISSVASSSTKVCIMNHLASNNNLADVTAKQGCVETAVSLIGLLIGMLVANCLASQIHYTLTIFALLTALNLYANHAAVSCLQFNTLNRPRARLFLTQYLLLDHSNFCVNTNTVNNTGNFNEQLYCSTTSCHASMNPLSIQTINQLEHIMYSFWDIWFGPILGCRVCDAIQQYCQKHQISHNICWKICMDCFQQEEFVLIPNGNGRIAICLKADATKMHILKGYIYAVLLQMQGCVSLDDMCTLMSSKYIQQFKWEAYVHELEINEWNLDPSQMQLYDSGWRFSTTHPLNEVVTSPDSNSNSDELNE